MVFDLEFEYPLFISTADEPDQIEIEIVDLNLLVGENGDPISDKTLKKRSRLPK